MLVSSDQNVSATVVVYRFFSQASEVFDGTRERFSFDPSEIFEVASNPTARAVFKANFAKLSDIALKERVRAYIVGIAEALEREAGNMGRTQNWFSVVGVRVNSWVSALGGGTTLTLMLASEAIWPGITVFGTGLAGLVGSQTLDNKLDKKRESLEVDAKIVRDLVV